MKRTDSLSERIRRGAVGAANHEHEQRTRATTRATGFFHEVALPGSPSRVRLYPDGQREYLFDSDARWLMQKPSRWDSAFAWQEELRFLLERTLAVRAELALFGHCSRCAEAIPDFAPPVDGEMTAGYYIAAAWQKYANPGEVYVCDACMWSDPRYVADYGPRPAVSETEEEH
jgi:uncharacterized protein (DUF736 family)